MGLTEKDPRDISYIALYVAINWYCYIPSDVALRIAQGRSHMLPGKKLTPEVLEEIKKIMDSPNFYNINTVVKKYRINKYDIFKALAKEKGNIKIASEEDIRMVHINALINKVTAIITKSDDKIINDSIPLFKKMQECSHQCTVLECEKCPLHKIPYGENTLCAAFEDMEITYKESAEIIKLLEIKDVHKSTQKYTSEDLIGETTTKTYRTYQKVIEKFDNYMKKHSREKAQDILGKALTEYMQNHI